MRAVKTVFLILFLTVLGDISAFAAEGKADGKTATPEKNDVVLRGNPDKVPPDLENVGVNEHLAQAIDLNLTFTSSVDNKPHQLKEYFQTGKPILLNLVYYECPMLCTMVLNGVVAGMKGLDWSVGKEFNVITISINPKEDKDMVQTKREAYVNSYTQFSKDDSTKHERDQTTVMNGWHFFTGEESQIKSLADQLGFSYTYDKIEKQYGHPAVTFILTPEGKISRYLYGITYRPRDLRLALLEASQGKIGNVFDRLLMFCYHYEPNSRGYALQAFKVMRVGGAGTAMLLVGYLAVFWIRQRNSRRNLERNKKGQQQ